MITFTNGEGQHFYLDRRAGEIKRSVAGPAIILPRKQWELLCFLVDRPGELLSRDQLLGGVWKSDGINVGNASLDKAVSEIRIALGDQAKPRKVIETRRGSGYRFIAAIRNTEEADAAIRHPPPFSPEESELQSGWQGQVETASVSDTDQLLREAHIQQRIREIWALLPSGKRAFVDLLLQPEESHELNEIVISTHSGSKSRLPTKSAGLHIMLEAVNIMPENSLDRVSCNAQTAICPYLAEALAVIVERQPSTFLEYSEAYVNVADSRSTLIQDAGAYAEAYSLWIDKTSLYLKDCQSAVRALSFNELTPLWDTPAGLFYLSTHYLLRDKRGCESKRVFIYDNTYFADVTKLRRLVAEVHVQSEAGVTVRVCSMERLEQIGKGYRYPLVSFGTYDRFAMGVLIPHNNKPLVKLIHDQHQVREAITVLEDIFDEAEPGLRWARKHRTQMDATAKRFTDSRIKALRTAIRSSGLD